MTRVQSADPGRVDEHQPAGEQRARDPDLDELDVTTSLAARGFLDPVDQRFEPDALDRPVLAVASMDLGARRIAVPDDGHGGRRQVVIDRTDRRPDQRVDQRALAVLELPDDADDGLGPGRASDRLVGAVSQIIPLRFASERLDVARGPCERLGRTSCGQVSRLGRLRGRDSGDGHRAVSSLLRPASVPSAARGSSWGLLHARLGDPATFRGE